MTLDMVIAGSIFLVAYLAIASERFDRTLVALLGGLAVIVLGVLDQDEAFAAVDFNVIFLLAGMMVLATAVARTGFFEALAIWAVRRAGHSPFRLLIVLAVLTAALSALLDNVTTVVLLTPVTLTIARTLGVSPIPYLIAQVFASNIGGTATLIGDPPNILIGSAADLDFGAFLTNLGPVVILIMVAFVGIMWVSFRHTLRAPREAGLAEMPLDPMAAITDRPLLVRSLIVLGATLAGFLVHRLLGLEAATIALLGATAVMFIGRLDPHETLREVEWSTLFFFVGLFILVEAVVKVGIVGGVADALATAANGRIEVAAFSMLWFSAAASAIVDNIPYTATAIPVVERLVEGGLPAEPLWWSLALGACLGGNLTVVGASANIVVANMAAREGHRITFGLFLRYGAAVVAASMLISSIYIWVRYLQ